MLSGIGKAVATVFPGIRDFICHFHFLRDIGKDYLEPAYARLRKGLRRRLWHRALQAMLADTPLVKNLDNPDYMKILLDGKENLEELFAELGPINLNGYNGGGIL